MICPNCEQAELELVGADEPWHDDYLICPICDSTYNAQLCCEEEQKTDE